MEQLHFLEAKRRSNQREEAGTGHAGGMLDERDNHRLSIRTSFMRPDAPLLIDTADLRHLKCFATSAMSSSFALPSIGSDLS